MRQKDGKWFYLFISPWLIGFISLTLGPILFSIYMSFTNWDLFQSPTFIGLDNYKTLLTDDPLFWKSVGNTFFYALISIPLGMAISLWISYYLNKKIKGITFFSHSILSSFGRSCCSKLPVIRPFTGSNRRTY